MKEALGNLWDFHLAGEWVAVTTNGVVDRAGNAVMGVGTALQAKNNYPTFPMTLGMHLGISGNVPGLFQEYEVATFPVKNEWRKKADLGLIVASAKDLVGLLDTHGQAYNIDKLYMPRPGCGAGNLRWKDVRTAIADIFDDRFIVLEYNP